MFSFLLCASVLINPVAWSYYFCLLLIPAGVLLCYLWERSFPDRDSFFVLLLFLILFIPPYLYSSLASLSFGAYHPQPIAGGFFVSFWASLFTLLPMLGLLGLSVMLRRLDRQDDADGALRHREVTADAPLSY